MIVWPADLPQKFKQTGFSGALADGRLLTPMESGHVKSRLRFSSVPRPVVAQINVSTNQLARFERFWNEDTVKGTRPFLVRDSIKDGQTMTSGDGDLLLDHDENVLKVEAWDLVMFGDKSPQISPVSWALYSVGFSLMVMP